MNSLYTPIRKLPLYRASQIISLSRLHSATKVLYQSNTPSAEAKPEKIVIPRRIERGPTDILNALSSTVGSDPTAAHYKYHDDPFLFPLTNVNKRMYAMAQEAGRKAAAWIRQENAKLFQHKEADPPVAAFVPTMIYTEESQVEETDLRKLIENVDVQDAILVYKLLKKNNIEVSEELRQSLMELLCFFNHEETLEEEYIEERWFQQGVTEKNRQRRTWKDLNLAEQIFHDIEEKKPEHYAALIRGMAKYYQIEKVWALYQETIEKQILLDTTTFNSILQIVSFLKEKYDERWSAVCDLLTTMKTQGLKPNVGTLNVILHTISTIRGHNHPRNYALKTLAEFKKLGIEPSLASWYYMLLIFCRERGPTSHILHDIMNEIENKEFQIQDPKDTFFFVTAMDVCQNHLHDKDLAKRVDKLLHFKDNYDLIGDSYKESIYYRHYFSVLCSSEPLEVFMETYNLLVPNVYIPEPSVMEGILRSIEMNGAVEQLPLIWSHMIQFDHIGKEGLLNLVLQTILANPQSQEQELGEKFTAIGWDMFVRVQELAASDRRSQQTGLSGAMLGNILLVCCRGKDLEKAQALFEKLSKEQNSIVGDPAAESLRAFVQLCIDEKKPSLAIGCLQYCSENGYPECAEFGSHIYKSLTLSEVHVDKIRRFAGVEAVNPKEVSTQESM
ncbi:protein PTCD3 homolog, mitochondrial [Toxorhynchites rutilus septentrionalis]|uniref:protein PTCD3 homolog, mitochondrial n=1 Tax=Toxorhynchites rutilus septentrionalis TaxID=329112 RepID=UPI002479DCE2|nr:protein PTCD3 homolog, mitochondrial [Toxorhynchites rutilus septentrionalis]